MNAKEALKICGLIPQHNVLTRSEAKGYLAALRGEEVKKLLEAATRVNTLYGCQNIAETDKDHWQSCGYCAGCALDKALEEFKKDTSNE